MASKIREVFLGEKGLNGAIRKLPIEGVFELKNVKKVGTSWFGALRATRRPRTCLLDWCIKGILRALNLKCSGSVPWGSMYAAWIPVVAM